MVLSIRAVGGSGAAADMGSLSVGGARVWARPAAGLGSRQSGSGGAPVRDCDWDWDWDLPAESPVDSLRPILPRVNDFALQLYTVRHALAAHPSETLRRVRAAGFEQVETAPPTPELPASRLASLLRDHGFSVAAAHCDLPWGAHQSRILDEAESLGTRRIVWHGWPKDPNCDSLGGFEVLLDRYLAAFEAARTRGLRLGLHNHWWEFEAVGHERLLPWLHRHLPPEIFFELDVYWAQTAGMDPLEVLAELGGRVRMVHMKDGPAIHGQPMTALGEGVVDLRSILIASRSVEAWVVELDECAADPLVAAERSLAFLKRLVSGSPG